MAAPGSGACIRGSLMPLSNGSPADRRAVWQASEALTDVVSSDNIGGTNGYIPPTGRHTDTRRCVFYSRMVLHRSGGVARLRLLPKAFRNGAKPIRPPDRLIL